MKDYSKNHTRIYLKPEEKQAFQDYAKSQGVSLSGLIRMILWERIIKEAARVDFRTDGSIKLEQK